MSYMPYPSLPGLPEGATVNGVIDYDIKKVEWNKYQLKSGLTVCFLALPQMVFTTNKVDPNGSPIYGISWSTFLDAGNRKRKRNRISHDLQSTNGLWESCPRYWRRR